MFFFPTTFLEIALYRCHEMDFRDLATALSDIIKEVEKATRVLGQSQLLCLEVLIETALRNGDISLEGVDLMNQASQQLYTFSNKLVVSSSYGEIRGWM